MIGENFTYNDDISGVVVSIRKAQNRIALWTKVSNDKDKCMKLGNEMKTFLGVSDTLTFQSHSDSAKKHSRYLYFLTNV